MFVRHLAALRLRRQILRCLQGFLHFLREFFGSHILG
jgi:hypothetical protein